MTKLSFPDAQDRRVVQAIFILHCHNGGHLRNPFPSILEVSVFTVVLAAVAFVGLYLWTLAEEHEELPRYSQKRDGGSQDRDYGSIL